MAQKTYSMAEVAKHNTVESTWLVVDGSVYDVTKFARLHPGGERILRAFAGKDATNSFWELHRADVLDKYARLKIGTVEGAVVPAPRDLGAASKVPYATNAAFQGFLSPNCTDSHREFQRRVKEFYARNITPACEALERSGKIAGKELRLKMAKPGILALLVCGHHPEDRMKFKDWGCDDTFLGVKPEDFDYFHGLTLLQETVRIGSQGLIDGFFGGSSIGLPPVAGFARKEVREKVVREVATGEKTIALAVSEPYAGSDVANLTCTAKKSACGRYFIVNGEKKWITGGCDADYFSTAVRTGGKGWGGVSMLLIPRTEGVVTKQIPTAYAPCAGTAYVMFTDVKVPVENLIGKQNMGVLAIAANFNNERFGMVVMINERCRIMIDECFRWCVNRKVFGKKLIAQPVIRQKLAEMSALVESMHHWIEFIGYQLKEMTPAQQFKKLGGPISLLKYHSTRVSIRVADHAAQIMGGRGLTKGGMGGKVMEFVRDIKFSAILGGAEEVMADFAMRDATKKIPAGSRL
jgi:alkylation response protein AidB-like acyl-CoA dehydrogenase/predicted heme/steroid binding protein